MKLYTVGQIGHKYKVPLVDVYNWAVKVRKVYGIWGRKSGIIKIPHDPYCRYGFPEEIVDIFPEAPKKAEIRVKRLMSIMNLS